MTKNKLIKNNWRKVIIVLSLIVLSISSIVVTIETATASGLASKMHTERDLLIDKKSLLKNELENSISNNQLKAKVNELGFNEPTNLVYIKPTEAVAKLP